MMPALIISFLKNAKYPTVPKNIWNVNRNAHHHCPFWQGAYIHNLRERWLKRIWLLLDPKRDLWSVFSTNVLMFVRQLQWRLARAKRDEWHLPERLVFAENWSSDRRVMWTGPFQEDIVAGEQGLSGGAVTADWV